MKKDSLYKFSKVVEEYAQSNGWAEVWRSWKDKMLLQGRGVRNELKSLPIPDIDKELDSQIAKDVIEDFLLWAKVYHGLTLKK